MLFPGLLARPGPLEPDGVAAKEVTLCRIRSRKSGFNIHPLRESHHLELPELPGRERMPQRASLV